MKAVGVVSVKGGVGKTLISINLAYRLREHGKVGLIDADIDNSNFASFTKVRERIEVENGRFKPVEWEGIKVFSMSLLVGGRAVSMTEDRYVQIIADAVEGGEWGDVDYVVIDLPAGASDVFRGVLEIFSRQFVGNVVVMQPAMADAARRCLYMHSVKGIPVVGLIENMAYLKLGDKVYHVFGRPVGQELAAEFDVPYLGALPLIPDLPERIEAGRPVLADEESEPILNAVKRVLEMQPVGPSLVQRVRETVKRELLERLTQVVAHIIISANREMNIGELQRKYGFTESRPFLLTITDEEGESVLMRVPLVVKDGRIKVIENPRRLDFEIVASVSTLARLIMGRRKVGKRVEPYSPWDAWLLGDLKVYGRGHSIKAVQVLRSVFEDESLMRQVREKYGRLLEVWI